MHRLLNRITGLLGFVAIAGFGHGVAAQAVPTGFLNRSVTIDGVAYRYQLYVPADYRPDAAWPVILFLHGSGERGADGMRPTIVGLGPVLRHAPERYPALVVFPQAPANTQWNGRSAEIAMAALRETLRDYRVDADRVYLTGLSMGGNGAWYLAYRNPGTFAAVVPICGWIVDPPQWSGTDPVVPPADGPVPAALARQLGRLPIWTFHGEMDDAVPVEATRLVATALAAQPGFRYTEYPGIGHNAWDPAYASKAFVEWLFAQRRRQP